MDSEKLTESIEALVNEIYTVDQKQIDEQFISFLGALEIVIEKGMFVEQDINQVLTKIQEAYIHKDYIRMSDIIQYELQ